MDDKPRYQLYKHVTDDPDSLTGQEFVQELLGGQDILSFPFSIAKGVVRSPDFHSVDSFVYVVQGNLTVAFGEQYQETVEAEKGDFLFIKKVTPHRESAGLDEDVKLIIFYIGDFLATTI